MKQSLVLAVILVVIACKYNTSYLFVQCQNYKSCLSKRDFDFLRNEINHEMLK